MAYIGKSPQGSGVRTRYYFTQTSGGATSISGTDDNGKTLSYTDGEYVDVYLNGVLLVHGTDYGTGTANTISSLAALANGDVVEVVVYDVYNVAKINSEAMRNRWYFTATGGETSIGTSQISNLVFPANAEIDVKLNGVTLQAGTDYNTTSANTVGGLSALTAGQVVEIVYYEKFVLGDTVSKASGGTFAKSVEFTEGLTSSGDLTVDTNTLHVDATNNRVGVGTASPSQKLHVEGAGTQFLFLNNSTTNDGLYLKAGSGASSIQTNGGSHVMNFFTSGTERMRIQSGGGISFNGDTAAANALDDYEEGNWSPTITGSGNSINPGAAVGRYRKIGNIVHVTIFINNNASNTFGSGAMEFTGLPYTSQSDIPPLCHSAMVRYTDPPSGAYQLQTYVASSSTTLTFYWSDNGNWTQFMGTDINNDANFAMYAGLSYLV